MGDQTQAYDIFQTPLSSGYPLPLSNNGSTLPMLLKTIYKMKNRGKHSAERTRILTKTGQGGQLMKKKSAK
jgi:hypothetical protein